MAWVETPQDVMIVIITGEVLGVSIVVVAVTLRRWSRGASAIIRRNLGQEVKRRVCAETS